MAALMEKSVPRGAFYRLLGLLRPQYTRLKEKSSHVGARKQPWQPVTLRTPMLASLIAFPLFMLVVLECLSNQSRRDGGIAFAKNGVSGSVQFAYNYLPTILAVSYSMMWAWIDLDAKRLEPYFQMSKDEGAPASQSFLLRYPLDLVIFPPIKAIRQRHWAVVAAGITSGLIFCGVTPISGAVFETKKVTHQDIGKVTMTAGLSSIENEAPYLRNGFLLNAYSNLWSDQALPGFTTKNGALRPFETQEHAKWPFSQSILSAPTEMYSSTLDCQPAATFANSSGVFYENGRGCIIPDKDLSALTSNSTSIFLSFYDPGARCLNSSKSFVAFSFRNQKPGPEMQTLDPEDLSTEDETVPGLKQVPGFEDADYYNVSLRWSSFWSKTVLFFADVQPLSPLQELPEQFFNFSDFEAAVGRGSSRGFSKQDINETTNRIDATQLDVRGMTDTVDNMIVLAVGISQLEPGAYLNSNVLATSLDSAYKLLFALALNSVLSPNVTNTEGTLGITNGQTDAILTNRILAIILEVLLGLVSLMTMLLLLICWNRQSQLHKDPNSISHMLELCNKDSRIPEFAKNAERDHDRSALSIRDGNILVNSSNGNIILAAPTDKLPIAKPALRRNERKLEQPFVMSLATGLTFLMILIFALIVMVVLWLCIQARHGLQIPSTHSVLTQLILNFLPVIFATLLEPYWTLLNRHLCLRTPLQEMKSGEALAFRSMNLKYCSLPPQLILWRALKARHLLLTAVCTVGLSANILAVALNAMLKTQVQSVESSDLFLKTSLPSIKPFPLDSTSSDHLYIAAANFTHQTPLPAWVSPDLYFLPFQTNTTSPLGKVQSYKSLTQGFGIHVECVEDNWTNSTGDYPEWTSQDKGDAGQPQINMNVSDVECFRSWDTYTDLPNGTSGAIELIAPFGPNYVNPTNVQHEACGNVLAIGFFRAQLGVPVVNLEGLSELSSQVTSAEWMTCRAEMETAMYEVQVDTSGRVLDYVRRGGELENASFWGNASIIPTLSNLFLAFDGPFNGRYNWRDGTYEDSWFGFLLKTLTNSTTLIDPNLPAPTFNQSSKIVEHLLIRLFPIVLSLRPTAFVPAPANTTVKGTMIVPCNRVFMSQSMFAVVVVLLLLNIGVAAAYYIYRPGPIPDEAVETIAGTLALFDGSGLVEEREAGRPWPKDWRFGYGNFIGKSDGKPRFGIERRPFVVPRDETKG